MSPIYVPGKVTLRNQPNTWAEGGDQVFYIDVASNPYRVHVFTTTGSSQLTIKQGGSFEYLVVAGGGAGRGIGASGNSGDGGDAGEFLTGSLVLIPGIKSIYVGSGGIGVANANGGNGENSTFDSITATGGTGGSGTSSIVARNGGAGGTGTPGQIGVYPNAGAGGDGAVSDITGTSTAYAGGGGGGFSYGGLGGLGGGGRGDSYGLNNGTPGQANTGGGGGGRSRSAVFAGYNGGSGIVIVRYAI